MIARPIESGNLIRPQQPHYALKQFDEDFVDIGLRYTRLGFLGEKLSPMLTSEQQYLWSNCTDLIDLSLVVSWRLKGIRVPRKRTKLHASMP
jgi:hypothetical protein